MRHEVVKSSRDLHVTPDFRPNSCFRSLALIVSEILSDLCQKQRFSKIDILTLTGTGYFAVNLDLLGQLDIAL